MTSLFSIANRESRSDDLPFAHFRVSALLRFCVLFLSSCSQYIDPRAPELVIPQVAPATGREYLLYRPSAYKGEHAWPLVVVCHASPDREIRRWTQLAEEHGFLVAAPELKRAAKSLLPKEDQQPTAGRDNETQILSVVEHIRAGHSVSEDRILIHGAAAGAIAALRAGLRHSDVFRAVSLVEPPFERESLGDLANYIDPYQPIALSYRARDLLSGKQGRACADWLRAYGADLRIDHYEIGNDPQRVASFFQQVIGSTQWMQVRASHTGAGNPLEVRLSLRTHSSPALYHWRFGDGGESPVAEPVHAYQKPGTYRVIVTVSDPKLGEHTRHVDLTVPALTLRPAHGPPQ
jgi:hypothetical protein